MAKKIVAKKQQKTLRKKTAKKLRAAKTLSVQRTLSGESFELG